MESDKLVEIRRQIDAVESKVLQLKNMEVATEDGIKAREEVIAQLNVQLVQLDQDYKKTKAEEEVEAIYQVAGLGPPPTK